MGNITLRQTNAHGAEFGRPMYMYPDITGNQSIISAGKMPNMAGGAAAMPNTDWELQLKQMMTAEDEALLKIARREAALGGSLFDVEQLRVFLLFAPINEIIAYITRGQHLATAAQKFVFLRGNIELIRWYLGSDVWVFDVNCTILAECCDDETILFYTGKHDFSPALTRELLRVGRFVLLERIQEQASLYSTCDPRRICRAHVNAILQAGHPELLKTQIRRYGLEESDVCLLLDSGNEEIIRYYLGYYELGGIEQLALVRLGNAALVQFYQNRYGFLKAVRRQAEKRGLLKARRPWLRCFGLN